MKCRISVPDHYPGRIHRLSLAAFLAALPLAFFGAGRVPVVLASEADSAPSSQLKPKTAKERLAHDFQNWLKTRKLDPASAKKLTDSFSEHPSRETLRRFQWAFSGVAAAHAKNGRSPAVRLARTAAELGSPGEFLKFQGAFHFFYHGQKLTSRLAIELSANLARGISKGDLQPDALDRYQWVFRKMPPRTQGELAADLDMADDLARLSLGNYLDFQMSFEKDARVISRRLSPPIYRRAFMRTGANFLPDTARTRSGWIEGIFDASGKRSLDQLLSLGLTASEIPGACAGVLNLPASAQVAPALEPCLALMPAINRRWPLSSEMSVPPGVARSLRLASESFGLPQKLLACSFWQESRFDPAALSGAGASGISQITPDAFKDILHVIQGRTDTPCPQPLSPQWALYRSAQRSSPPKELQRQIPIGGLLDFSRLTQDPDWSIGAGALWTKCYEHAFFGTDDLRQLSIEDLAMLTGAYNMGVSGLERYCRPHDIEGCLRNLKAAGIKETYNHIQIVYQCLKKP